MLFIHLFICLFEAAIPRKISKLGFSLLLEKKTIFITKSKADGLPEMIEMGVLDIGPYAPCIGGGED